MEDAHHEQDRRLRPRGRSRGRRRRHRFPAPRFAHRGGRARGNAVARADGHPRADADPVGRSRPRPFVVTNTDAPVQTTVTIASSGWVPMPGLDAISKDDDGLDSPETVGAALLAWAWPAGTGFNVYGDPCHWSTTIPETPATTPDEIAAAFAAQASTDATAPVDVTVGGYAGKAITLNVPMSFDLPNATREEKFADCDNAIFGFYGVEGEPDPARNAQGAGQIDELWILDVDGSIVILDATYCTVDAGRPRRRAADSRRIGHVRVADRSISRPRPTCGRPTPGPPA